MANTAKDTRRHRRLRNFMEAHDIKALDISEQLGLVNGKCLTRQAIHDMLFRRDRMVVAIRDKLIDLGFPENTLPPPKGPRFPGLKNNPQATA